MDKNWLIRTKSNHILGPVSKDKVLELYHNGSIKPDDEVCSGNGYWFFIREEELVAKYLTGKAVQGFNPISEAKDVLTSKGGEAEGSHEPDDITMVGGINLSMLNKPQSAPQSEPDMPPMPEESQTSAAQATREAAPSENKKKNKITPRLKPTGDTRVLKPVKRQDWMKYVAILGFIFLFALVYFRNVIINYIFQGEITQISIISPVYAQEDIPEKKKSF